MGGKITLILPYIRLSGASRCLKLAQERSGLPKGDLFLMAEYDEHRIGCPKMVRYMAQTASTDLVCFVGDDCIPQQDFLKNALADMSEFEDGWGLVGLNDNTGRSLITHWLAHKKLLPYVGGEFFHTGYTHCCCDVELQERASAIGRSKLSKTAFVLHDHPLLKNDPSLIVRYVLYYPFATYLPTDMVFVYDSIFEDSLKRVDGYLWTPIIESDLFVNPSLQRDGVCHWIGKGVDIPGFVPFYSEEITMDYPATRKELAGLFKRKELFFCLDPATSLVFEAALCGCPTIVPPKLYDVYKASSFRGYGVASSMADVHIARATTHMAKRRLTQLDELFEAQSANFIDITQRGTL